MKTSLITEKGSDLLKGEREEDGVITTSGPLMWDFLHNFLFKSKGKKVIVKTQGGK